MFKKTYVRKNIQGNTLLSYCFQILQKADEFRA